MTEIPRLLRTFWSSEIVAENLYGFLAKRYGNEQKKTILEIGRMEHGHGNVWNKLAQESHGVSFRVSLFIRMRIALLKLLSLLLPLTIFVHYMEHEEKKAILDYAGLLAFYRDDPEVETIIINVIRQEIGHEWHMMEQIADRKGYIEKVGEAFPALMAGIVGTLGLVIGLSAARAQTLVIGFTGLIGMFGGMIAEMSVSYVASKNQRDFDEGKHKELGIKTEVSPAMLHRELEKDLIERGTGSETTKLIMDAIGNDTVILSNLVKTIRTSANRPHPHESLKTTATFFALGALPILVPFFVGNASGWSSFTAAAVGLLLAAVSISVAGLFTAVLSGRKISTTVVHNLFIIMATCALTYAVGFVARFVLSIQH